MTTLIDRLNQRAHDPKRAIDDWRGFVDANDKQKVFVAHPPATEEQVAAAEARLGFPLPPLLRRLYLEVGNGGFGPGYGMYGVATSADDERGSVVGYYAEARGAAASAWPERLLPICTFGCGIDSCLDCSRPEATVVRLDPNMEKADVAKDVPVGMQYDRAAEVGVACWVEAASLEEWLTAWVDGRMLFYLGYGEDTPDDEDEEYDEDEGDE